MTSKEFWKNRSISNHKKALLLAENDIKELKKLMYLNLKDVQRQIKEFYDKYGEEPTKQLTLFEVDQYKKNLKSNCKKYPKSRTLKKAYIDDYPKYKITRLRAFETQLQTNIAYITSQQEKKIKVTLNQVARNGANLTAQMICEGLNFDFNALNNRILNKIVNEDWAGGGNWSKRIWGRCDNAAGKITDVLSRGLPQGKSLQSISSELCKATETSFNDAFRLVRTESGHILNQVHKESFLELQDEEGEKLQYEYCAYLDDKTSEICKEMNGKVFYYDDAVEGENFPPLHPNCRSCTVPVMEEEKEKFTEFSSAEEADNFFNNNSKYQEWAKSLSTEEQLMISDYTDNRATPINTYLRTGKTKEIKRVKYEIEKLDKLIEKSELTKNITVYRAIPPNIAKEIKGAYYSDKAFLSTSLDKQFILENTDPQKAAVLVLNIPKGKGIGAYLQKQSFHKEEYEFLLRRNTKFKIVSNKTDENGKQIFTMDLISHHKK